MNITSSNIAHVFSAYIKYLYVYKFIKNMHKFKGIS